MVKHCVLILINIWFVFTLLGSSETLGLRTTQRYALWVQARTTRHVCWTHHWRFLKQRGALRWDNWWMGLQPAWHSWRFMAARFRVLHNNTFVGHCIIFLIAELGFCEIAHLSLQHKGLQHQILCTRPVTFFLIRTLCNGVTFLSVHTCDTERWILTQVLADLSVMALRSSRNNELAWQDWEADFGG